MSLFLTANEVAGAGMAVSGYLGFQQYRMLRKQSDLKVTANRNAKKAEEAALATNGWQALAEEWRNEIQLCHDERQQCKEEQANQRIEISKLRTLVVAMQKIHDGEFPGLKELKDVDDAATGH